MPSARAASSSSGSPGWVKTTKPRPCAKKKSLARRISAAASPPGPSRMTPLRNGIEPAAANSSSPSRRSTPPPSSSPTHELTVIRLRCTSARSSASSMGLFLSVVSAARQAAFRVVRRVLEQDAYADRALEGEARGLDRRDRAFAQQLTYGTVQRRATLDHVIGTLVERPPPAPARAALQLGLYQLLFLDGVPDHAAVGESVELISG